MQSGNVVFRKIVALLVLLIALTAAVNYFNRSNKSPLSQQTPEERQNNQEALLTELGLSVRWNVYKPAVAETLNRWRPGTAKIIFEFENEEGNLYYLVDLKRAGGKKDRHWEFPGGRVDQGEEVTAALMRELGEEDPSDTLCEVFKHSFENGERPLYYKNIVLRNGGHETLFKTGLTQGEWTKLRQYWQAPHPRNKEIYDFVLLPLDQLDTRMSSIKKNWTRKSRKILKALRESSSPL